jgi:large subunit ribosomal protein L24
VAKIKVGDMVVVTTGKDKDLTKAKKVLSVLEDLVVVEGVAVKKKHSKPNPAKGQVGGIIDINAPIHISNVAIFNPKTQRADRVGYVQQDGKKARVYQSTKELIATV